MAANHGRDCKEIEEGVRRFENNCLQEVMKNKLYDRVGEKELRQGTGQQSIAENVKIARWKWYGHFLRMPNERLATKTFSWKSEGT